MRFPKSKVFGVALCGLSVCGVLTGCENSYSPTGSDSEEQQEGEKTALEKIMEKYDNLPYEYEGEECTISMCHWDSSGASIEKQVVDAVLQGFNKRYPTIHVNLEILSNYETTYPSRLAAGTVHDVFLMPDGSFNAWAKTNTCENLDAYIAGSDLVVMDEMYESSLNRYRYDLVNHKPSLTGNQLALPKDIGPTVLYYNKDIFDSMGVAYPSATERMTYDEATEMWKAVTKRDKNGNITKYGVSGLPMEGLVWSAGGDFLNADRSAFPTDAKTLAGLKKGYQYIQDAYVKDFITPPVEFTTGSDGITLFSQERVACYIGLKAYCATFRGLDFDWDVAPVPAFEENPTASAWSGSVGYSLYNKSEHKEAAWKLIEYIASKEGQEILSATGFQIPCYPDIGNSAEFIAQEKKQKPSNVEVFLMEAEGQPAGLWCYRDTQTWKTLGYDATSELLFSSDESKRITVDTFLDQVKAKVNGMM